MDEVNAVVVGKNQVAWKDQVQYEFSTFYEVETNMPMKEPLEVKAK
jgi:hypothetical protein